MYQCIRGKENEERAKTDSQDTHCHKIEPGFITAGFQPTTNCADLIQNFDCGYRWLCDARTGMSL